MNATRDNDMAIFHSRCCLTFCYRVCWYMMSIWLLRKNWCGICWIWQSTEGGNR